MEEVAFKGKFTEIVSTEHALIVTGACVAQNIITWVLIRMIVE